MESSWPEVDRLRLAALLAASMGALFIALVAMLFESLDLGADRSWRLSSAVMALHGVAVLLTIVPKAWRVTRGSGPALCLFRPAFLH